MRVIGFVVVSGFAALGCGGKTDVDSMLWIEESAGSGGRSGVAAGGTTGTGGVHPTPNPCPQASLDVAWPVISGCISNSFLTWRCPHPSQINTPDYGPFVACCPPDMPFSCPNGTPHSCFKTASEAASSCGKHCVTCTAP